MLIMQLPQDRDVPVGELVEGPFGLVYGSYRAEETRRGGESGQDYLAFRLEGRRAVFCLCDGVSQSYYGDLAARFIGNALLDWMESIPVEKPEAELTLLLTRRLEEWVKPGTELLERHKLPEGLPSIVREVLDAKKRIGSEAAFLCGKVEAPAAGDPGRLLLASMGDSRVRLWGIDEELGLPGEKYMETRSRWSTVRGAVNGPPKVWSLPLAGTSADRSSPHRLRGITVYTDGAARLDGCRTPLTREELELQLAGASREPDSDDATLLQLVWQHDV